MILKQYYLGCLAHASYLVADEASRTAAVVDPQRDIDLYLADAEAHGVVIRHVLIDSFSRRFSSRTLGIAKPCRCTDLPGLASKSGVRIYTSRRWERFGIW